MADAKAKARDAAPLVLRLAVGAIFVYHGAHRLGLTDSARGVDTTMAAVNGLAAELGRLGISPEHPLAWAAALGAFLGGAFLVLGFVTRVAAGVLAVALAGAFWKIHVAPGMPAGGLLAGKELNLLLIAASISLMMLGSGPLALDGLFERFHKKKDKGGK